MMQNTEGRRSLGFGSSMVDGLGKWSASLRLILLINEVQVSGKVNFKVFSNVGNLRPSKFFTT